MRRTLDAFLRVHYLPDPAQANARADRAALGGIHTALFADFPDDYVVTDWTADEAGQPSQGFSIAHGGSDAQLMISCLLPYAVLFGGGTPSGGPTDVVGNPAIWYVATLGGSWLDPVVDVVQRSGLTLLSGAVARADPGFRLGHPDHPESYFAVLFSSNFDTP